jgi:arylsulfatase
MMGQLDKLPSFQVLIAPSLDFRAESLGKEENMTTRTNHGRGLGRAWQLALLAGVVLFCAQLAPAPAHAATPDKPNIVVIWGDDIGISNVSAYSEGLMGYETPNIDRLAKEGMKFTDYYAENSCTAGRAAFITGQSVYRTGNSKVGLPGAKQGLNPKDPTIAELLKPMGYATAQFGKNHLGDRNEYLPCVHGFDEFMGVLYHLNAMQDIFSYDYPPPPFLQEQGPRGVIDCRASNKDDKTVDPRFGKVGKQVIVSEKMWKEEEIAYFDDKVSKRAQDFIERKAKEDKPFFVWVPSGLAIDLITPRGPYFSLKLGSFG